MSRPSLPLIDLVVELRLLGRRDRRSILDRLGAPDRERVASLLGKTDPKAAPTFDALAALSPWLSESLADVHASHRQGRASIVTAATREALLQAERLLPQQAINRPLLRSKSWIVRAVSGRQS